ncbi:MAG: hypothetical protein IKB56_05695 [Clostridia bacterium]|nr:hypothetical protein [Clostridia bacterium]
MDINEYIKRKNKGKKERLTPEEAVMKYSKMDEASLMQELFKTAEEGRRNGELDNGVLDGFMEKMAPLLSKEQAERMKELINGLKR